MRRTPVSTLLAAVSCCLVQCTATANDIEPGKEYYSAIHTPRAVTLDGNVSEWSGVPVLADPKFYVKIGFEGQAAGKGTGGVGAELVLFEEYSGGTWTGPDDQTSAVQIAYDADNVYFGFVVTDDYHQNSATGVDTAWNGDSVQLMIANAARDTQVALYNYAISGTDESLGEVYVHHEAGPGGTEAVVARNTATKKTTYEIKLPKEALGLTSLTGGTKFGLGMAINDGDDGEGQQGQKGWGGLGAHAIVFGKSPNETALVTLARKNDIEPGKEIYTANPAPKPIVLDGNLTEWSGVPVLADPKFYVKIGFEGQAAGKGTAGVGAELVLFEEYSGGTWTGPDDQTSAVQIAYDADNVFFGFVVTDDYHQNSATGVDTAWNGDSVQLMIADGAQATQVALYNYAVSGTDESIGDVYVHHEAGPGGTEAFVARNTTTKKTTYEIKLPKEALGLTSLAYGTQFGLGMAINDGDDGEGQQGQKGWGGLGAHSIVFGKTPGETALVTLGVGGTAADLIYLSAVNPTVTGFNFRVNDLADSVCDPASAKLYIDGTSVTLTVTPKAGATDFTYTRPTYFTPNSEHTYIIEVKDTQGHVVSDSATFTTPTYALLTSEIAVTPDTAKRGFIWNVHQNSAFQANDSTRPLQQLGGGLGQNYADPSAQGVAIAAGTAGANNRMAIRFEIDSLINMCPNGGGAFGDFVPDDIMPGIPGTDPTATEDGIAGEVITYIDLPAGKHTFNVRSDDGFFTKAGNIYDAFQGMTAADSAGAVANINFDIYVQDAGVYAFRTVWEEGGGDAYLEWSSIKADGTKVLLNDTANGGLTCYRAITGGKGPAAIAMVSPAPGATGVAFDAPVLVQLKDGQNIVDAGSVKLTVDGAAVSVTPSKVGDLTTVNYQPAAHWPSGSQHTINIAYTSGGAARSESWQFTVVTYATLTKAHQAVSVDTSKRGFIWRVFQNETYMPNSLAACELALAGELRDTAGNLLENLADPYAAAWSLDFGTKVGALYQFILPAEMAAFINLSQLEGTALGNFAGDQQMCGIPGTTASTDGIDAEVITFVQLPAGVVTLTVVSDDSFRAQAGYINKPADGVLLYEVDGATANVTFRLLVQDAGVYPLRVIWQEGIGDAGLELSSVKADGTRALLNDTDNGGFPCYYTGVAPDKATGPITLAVTMSGANVEITWTDAAAALEESTNLKTWTAVAGAASPYRPVLSAAPAKFYRLRK